jgi:hypothetical protein
MKLNDAVARLERAGDENSRMWVKIGEAIDELALALVKLYPQTNYRHDLPRGFKFEHFESDHYSMSWDIFGVLGTHVLTDAVKKPSNVLKFCDELKKGLLDEISVIFETETNKLTEAVSSISEFIARM